MTSSDEAWDPVFFAPGEDRVSFVCPCSPSLSVDTVGAQKLLSERPVGKHRLGHAPSLASWCCLCSLRWAMTSCNELE